MMKKIKVIGIVFLVVLACFQLFACQSSSKLKQKELSANASSGEIALRDVPEEYMNCLENFLNAMETDTFQSAKYAYFPNETIRHAHENSGVTLIDYSIESAEKLRNNLYAFNLILKDDYNPEPYKQWKFVGEIDGEILVIGNVNYIPEELTTDFEKDKYEVKTDETLPQDAIIFDLEN